MSLRIRMALVGTLALLSLVPAAQAAQQGDIFPFQVHETRLDNGLQVLTIPYESPGTVAYYLVVRTGSRDEVEAGHSGFAHFFEHMMFRGTERFSQDEYTAVLKRLGANSNASTSDDVTIYQLVGPARELETMMDIESDRFKNLKYSEDDFRTEALAVLGEYNKNVSSQFLPMWQKMRGLAFQKHTYKHTTIGFLEDIKMMPERYDYSLKFFQRFYRPENITLLVVGDAQPQRVTELARKYYGDWKKGYQTPAVQSEPPQAKAQRAHIDWANPTRPYMMIGHHMPAYSTKDMDSAAADLIDQLLFSETAPLYRELVVEKQWVDFIASINFDHRDPYLFTMYTQVKSEDLLPQVEEAYKRHIRQLQEQPVDAQRLERTKSYLRYSFARTLDTPTTIADVVSRVIGAAGDYRSVNERFAQYQKVTPADIQRAAKRIFQPQAETVVTLSTKAAAEAPAAGSQGGSKP